MTEEEQVCETTYILARQSPHRNEKSPAGIHHIIRNGLFVLA